MDREAVTKKIKLMKGKAKAARKANKRDQSLAFKYGMRRLVRELKANTPKAPKKKAEPVQVPGSTPTASA